RQGRADQVRPARTRISVFRQQPWPENQEQQHHRDGHQKHGTPPEVGEQHPPTSGPMAAPAEKLADHTPMAKVRCCGSRNMLRIRDRVEGARVAEAMPCSARAAISIWALVEKAAAIEQRPKAAAPIKR